MINNKTGITLKQLKQYIKNLPETDSYGEPYLVWVEHTDDEWLSTPIKSICKIDKGDIIFTIREK